MLYWAVMSIPFSKMSGAGNTFVVIDNRNGIVEQALADSGLGIDAFVIRICSPVTGVGSDGLILIENADGYDFSWRFFNSDGSHANMCGNGARCAARFAQLAEISGDIAAFETGAGIIHSEVRGERVFVELTPPGAITPHIELVLGGEQYTAHLIDTGVPHLVIPVEDVNRLDVAELGAQARFHQQFEPDGCNVNFAALTPEGIVKVRTYERGVEGETMACGTGVTAVALVLTHLGETSPPVTIMPMSGERLQIHFDPLGDGFENVVIEGPARVLFTGEITAEALSA